MAQIIIPTPSTGGTPSGSNTQVQFNDGGAFGGDAGLVYAKTTDTLTIAGSAISPLFRSGSAGNIPFVANPLGTAGFQLQVADSTATGGNARGNYAIDLQLQRTGASQVASGSNSFACGSSNTASGTFTFTSGTGNIASGALGAAAMGFLVVASGQSAMAVNNSTTASGANSFAANNAGVASGVASFVVGGYGNSKNIENLFVLGSSVNLSNGKFQANILNVGAITTDATPTVLKSNSVAPSNFNQLVLQNNSAIAFSGLGIATITGGGDTAAWEIKGCIKRGANAASTALVGVPTVTSIGSNAGASGWTLTLTADTTIGGLAATATNGAGVTVRVNLALFASEVAF